MKFEEIDLLKIGNTIGVTGIILSGEGIEYNIYLPDNENSAFKKEIQMSLDDWNKLTRQMDLIETEVLAKDKDGLKKIIIRKTTRIIDQKVSWKVYQRDNYTCRYCGRTGIPMTVDHLVLWEEGGPSIEENLLTSCRNCNKERGNTQYPEWLISDYYHKVSNNLSEEIKKKNLELIQTLKDIPIKLHKTGRK